MVWQIFLSILATSALWPTMEMLLTAVTGDQAAKNVNGLWFLVVFFNFPLVLIVCSIVTFLLYRYPATRYKTFLFYTVPTLVIMVVIRLNLF